MSLQTEKCESSLRRLRGRAARSRSVGTKVTPDEERQILAAAEAEGNAPSEWARDRLMRGVLASNRGEMEFHLFTELVGIQMLLMRVLDPLLRGEKMAQEQLTALYRRVQTTKAAQAQELLAKRSQKKEKLLQLCAGRRSSALLGDDVVVAKTGDFVFKPRNQGHTFWYAREHLARILEIISPAGFAFHTLSFPWLALKTRVTQSESCRGRFEYRHSLSEPPR